MMYRRNFLTGHLALICCGLFLMALPRTADAQTAQQIAKNAFGCTVLLVMDDASGQSVSLGSGFFVRDGEIASNLHVVKGASRGYAKLVGQQTTYDIEGITGIDSDHDLVLLKISAPRTVRLSLGNSDAVQVGDPVYAVGNPQGLEGTFSQGIISNIRGAGLDKLLQITAPISLGSSGGPVLNSKGEVIGVSVATFKAGQNLNFAIPSNHLKTLLANSGPAKPLVSAWWRKSRDDVVKAMTAYRKSLEKLRTIYEQEFRREAQEVVDRRLDYEKGIISRLELEESERKLAKAEAKLKEIEQKIADVSKEEKKPLASNR